MKIAAANPSGPDFKLVDVTLDDLPSVVALEEECGLTSRGIDGYRKRLADPHALIIAAAILPEGDDLKSIIGLFAGDVVLDELQIDNLAVKEPYRRRGIARSLLRAALLASYRRGARRAVLEVRAANLPALALYASLGFFPAGTRKGYYRDPADDALILLCEIDGPGVNEA